MLNFILLLATLLGVFSSQEVSAEFTLDFQKTTPSSSGWGNYNCGLGATGPTSGCGTAGTPIDPDSTPYFQETVTVGDQNYWHQIIGDPADGFAMEVYVAAWTGGTNNSIVLSASGGKNFIGDTSTQETQSGNGWDPLRSTAWNGYTANDYTGNGTGDPRKVIMRQILGGSWDGFTWSCEANDEFCYDFEKAEDTVNSNYITGNIRSLKPVITLNINDPSVGMSSSFKIDMSNSDYLDSSTPGTVVNTLTITGAPGANFDMSTDAQLSTITGGRYVFNPATDPGADELGWVNTNPNSFDFDEGSYTYAAGGIDLDAIDWESYRNDADNPWFGSGNAAKCDSGLIFGNCP